MPLIILLAALVALRFFEVNSFGVQIFDGPQASGGAFVCRG